MSGYLSMSVPFLAAALAYGVGRATSLASSVLHVGQEAASAAAREGATGNLSLGSTQMDTHRFATLEGRQVRTSAHVDTGRYSGYAPEGAAYTVAADGTAIADAGVATSRLPAAGVRLSESLAASHENRAAQSRTLAENFSAEASAARSAAATDATAMVERHARDVSTGTAHAHGVTESESSQAQALSGHMDRLSEIAGITKDQAAVMTAEATLGGGWGKVVRIGASGSATWRGQTIESEAFNRLQDYAEENRVMDLWSSVSEASRRYSTATGESELASLEDSFGANLTRMRRFEDRAGTSFQTAENWSAQAAQVRAESQAIDRDLGQPFFAWLAERPGGDGRPIGVGGALRLATPQTPEEAETLREHAAAFVEERIPVSPDAGGLQAAGLPSRATFEDRREALQAADGDAASAAHGDWTEDVRGRGREADVPTDVGGDADAARARTEGVMAARGAEREARSQTAEAVVETGRDAVEEERTQPMGRQVLEEVPLIGGWLAGRLYGTAGNAAPDGAVGHSAVRRSADLQSADSRPDSRAARRLAVRRTVRRSGGGCLRPWGTAVIGSAGERAGTARQRLVPVPDTHEGVRPVRVLQLDRLLPGTLPRLARRSRTGTSRHGPARATSRGRGLRTPYRGSRAARRRRSRPPGRTGVPGRAWQAARRPARRARGRARTG